MRISGWHIDGFGIFADERSPELPDGLTVFCGANEAGKSTLLAFVRGVLFGFPDRRHNKPLYPPLAGGRHGGRILLADADGTYTVERDAGKRTKPRIILPDGSAGAESDLQRLLGKADATLFESVFAFSLSELQEFGSLEGEGIADRIFSAGLVGAGQSAQLVLEQLDAQAGALYKPRAKAEINGLMQDYDEVERRLREARAAVSTYITVDARLAAAQALVESLAGAVEEVRLRSDHVADLQRLWTTWCEVRDARVDLQARGGPSRLEPAQVAALNELEAGLSLHQERLASLPGLARDTQQADDGAADSLRELGREWDSPRLERLNTSLEVRDEVAAWSRRLSAAEAAAEEARRDLALAQTVLDRSSGECRRAAEQQPAEEPPSRDELDRRDAALTRLRGLLHELRVAPTAPGASAPGGARLVLAVIALAALGLAAWSFVSGAAVAGAGLVLAGAALLVVALRSRAGGAPASPAAADQVAEAAKLSQSLGFASPPSFPQIEDALRDLRRQSEARRAYDDGVAQLALLRDDERRAGDEVAQAAVRAQQAATEHESVRSDWAAWKAAHDVPGQFSPDSVTQFFLLAAAARDRLLAAARSRAELAAAQQAVAAWEERATTLLGAPDSSGETLVAAFRTLADDVRGRLDLEATIAQGERTITLQLGEGAAAEEARRELESGDIEGWRLEAERLAAKLSAATADHVKAVEERRDIENERRRLQESADVAALDAEREALVARIDEALRRWRVARLAHGLMSATLDEFVREHQPKLLEHATRLFAAVTEGRYVQLVQEGIRREIAVLDASGGRKRPADLSRGTAEQLYLCLRLSFAAEFAARTVNLPLVMDDVLVNFDPQRARAMARVLAETAAAHQVLFFTCHPATRDLLVEAADGHLTVVDLDAPALTSSST